jgi:hypothetical protein
MTDENQKLRSRIAELEKQLIGASLGNALTLELSRRGLDQSKIEDALELLGATHDPASASNIRSAPVWYTEKDAKRRTLGEMVDEFQSSKDYFFTGTQRAEPEPDGPTDANGNPVPMDQRTSSELAEAAGAFPKATTPEESYTDEQLENMSVMDRLAYLSGAAPKVERDDSDLAEINAELEARAEHREEAAKQTGLPMFEAKPLKWNQQ